MTKKESPRIRILPKNFDRNAEAILTRIQPELLPERAEEIVAINVTTGEYVIAKEKSDVRRAFRERWPDEIAYIVRADGGPVGKLSWA